MADQPPIRDVVLRCRDCGQQVAVKEAHQECESFRCRISQNHFAGAGIANVWSGWEIAHITRAEAA